MRIFQAYSRQKNGVPPGTPVHVGDVPPEPPTINLIDYSESNYEVKQLETPADARPYRESNSITWVNINGVHDVDLIEEIGDIFGLHPLVLEDIANTEQRPKFEDYGDYFYLTLRMVYSGKIRSDVESEQVSFVTGDGFVLSFQERHGDVFEPVRARIREGKGRIRRMGVDYLTYSLLDSTVDGYFSVLETIGDVGEDVHEMVIDRPEPDTLQKVHTLKRQLIAFRKGIWPLREAVNNLQKSDTPLVTPETRPYLRDLYDHTIQVMDTVETYRELVASMTDLYMNSISNRMNEVMKVLTIIATIFIPLTFIAGVYGMNFKYMPELEVKWAYPAVLLLMLVIMVGMMAFFRKKQWL